MTTPLLFISFLFRSATSSDRNAEKERRLNANMIERRRMQNINTGFTSLKRLLPPTEKKQTKAAILQQAAQHMMRLQRTVVQLRENNNSLRQDLAEERKQSLQCREKLDAFISEKLAWQEFKGQNMFQFPCGPKVKGQPPTPPREVCNEGAFNRWSPVLYDGATVNSYEVFDLPSCRNSRKRGLASMMGERYDPWEDKVSHREKHFTQLQRSSLGTCADVAKPSYQEPSRFSVSRGFPDAGTPGPVVRKNNLHCIVDAINLIEQS